MDRKLNQSWKRHALIASLVLGSSHLALEASIPCFSALADKTNRARLDLRLANGTNIAGIGKIKELVESCVNGKSFNPNQKIIFGTYLPIIFYAASLPTTNALDKLLEDNNTVVAVESSLGDTPMHAAAINSAACLQKLIEDGRLDLNEHNYAGETPLYAAMANGNADSIRILMEEAQSSYQNAGRLNTKSRDNNGRTILHVACLNGDANVVKEILKLASSNGKYKDNVTSYPIIDSDIKDFAGKRAVEYIQGITDKTKRDAVIAAWNEGIKAWVDTGTTPKRVDGEGKEEEL